MLKRILMMLPCLCLPVAGASVFTPPGAAFGGAIPSALPAYGGGQEQNAPTAIQLLPILTGLSNTVFVTHAHDGTNRLFVIEKAGRIRVAQPGAATTSVFMDITARVNSTGNEEGLLGLAFHPQYAANGRFFVYYNHPGDGALVISEFHVSAADPNAGDPNSEIIFLTIPHPGQTNHNGGMMAFGQDGFLYMGTGDGGSGDDPPNNAQNINVLLGKMLRINVDNPNGSVPYSSPVTNPFFGSIAGADEIYAYGLRNPWRWSFDRVTGQLICGDVGQGTREEIDFITNGGNYGWRVMEGLICNPDLNGGVCTPPSGSILPIFDYGHTAGRCSITGGYIYRGFRTTLPTAAYVYADYCTGEIWQLQGSTNTLLMDTALNITSFGEDEAGEVYVVGQNGTINRLSASPAPPNCAYSFSSFGQLVGQNGAVGAAQLTTASDCGWLAATNVPWITLPQSIGAGGSSVSFTVQSNPTGSPRTGLIRAGGQAFSVVQEGSVTGSDCPTVVTPTFRSFPGSGGAASIAATLEPRCAWQATPSNPWITITSANVGAGSATVNYAVAMNNTNKLRVGTITIGTAVFTVKQKP